jgi:hypothetical protein
VCPAKVLFTDDSSPNLYKPLLQIGDSLQAVSFVAKARDVICILGEHMGPTVEHADIEHTIPSSFVRRDGAGQRHLLWSFDSASSSVTSTTAFVAGLLRTAEARVSIDRASLFRWFFRSAIA